MGQLYVFAFSVGEDYIEYIVAYSREEAKKCLDEETEMSDMADEYEDEITCTTLEDADLDTLKIHGDEEDEESWKSFRWAIQNEIKPVPYHLCSYIN